MMMKYLILEICGAKLVFIVISVVIDRLDI